VDTERFSPAVDGGAIRRRLAPGGELLLLSVGRLQRRKGHDLAIQAVAAIRDRYPLRYVIAGDGDERRRLEDLARSLGVLDVVTFAGAVPPDELPQYFAAADVFLLPNRVDSGDVEGFGIVFLEASSTGTPVIGGNNGGVPEAVASGETGWLVSGVDVDELAQAIGGLAADAGLRARLGAAGRERVLRSFTWQRAAQSVASIHRSMTAVRSVA
jgi:phosphatidylinositol alpha-1,6-mannosyltransferase